MRRRRRAVWLHLISAVVVGAATSVLTAVPSIANPVLVVTSTADSGSHTLRNLISKANATPGPDQIEFNLPGAAPHVIKPTSALPAINETLTIDGTTQPGITSIVDGAHAFAHVPFQFSDLDCDFYGASLHKWLSAPIGTGMLFVCKDRIEKHWALMAAPPSMDKNIRKFEEIGTHPAAMHNATLQALEFHDQIGAERKFARLRYLKNRWAERLSKVPGAKVLVELEPNQSGAFATIHFDTIEPAKLSDALLSKYNIFVVPIKGPGFDGIRVSSNVYTSPGEIDQFCAAVEAIVPRA